jgi:3',5'-cyclic AMP phosphodiesterase CpdA
MNIGKTIRIFVSLVIILISSCGLHRSPDKTFSFIQITDPQFGFYSNNNGFNEEVLLYEKAVTKINTINPVFVIITGDVVNDKSNKSQWDEFRRITSLINPGIKVYLTPGNHDIGQDPEKKDIDYYTSMFGSDRFSFGYGNCRFIGFNSCLIKAETPGLEEEQLEWLKEELAAASGARQIMLFCHHPFFIRDLAEPENYSNIKPESRRKYLSLFSEYGVDAIFSGHLHNNASGIFNKSKLITTSAVGKPLADAPSGLRIIQISGEEFKHQYFPLDSVRVLK